MAKEGELVEKFWKALQSDMTVMLGLAGVEEGHSRPMTAQLDGDSAHGPIWFFTAKDTEIVQALGAAHRGVVHFASKGHDSVRDAARRCWCSTTIARRSIASGIRSSPRGTRVGGTIRTSHCCASSRQKAQVWLNENSLFTGVKMLLGADPKKSYRTKWRR